MVSVEVLCTYYIPVIGQLFGCYLSERYVDEYRTEYQPGGAVGRDRRFKDARGAGFSLLCRPSVRSLLSAHNKASDRLSLAAAHQDRL